MRETDVLVVGAGRVGLEAAMAAVEAGLRVLVLDKAEDPGPLPSGLKVLTDAMVLDVILSEEGEVAGALIVNHHENEVQPLRAKAVVLATGGLEDVYSDSPSWRKTGDGYAVAHRAGADLVDVTPTFDPEVALAGGVESDREGATTVTGLYVAGTVSSQRAPGRAAGVRAAMEAPEEQRAFGDYTVMPNIDSPLPRGFADAKFARLRAVMQLHFGPHGARDAERGSIEVHKLKGEADDFARARVDPHLLSFKNACEVAALVANAARGKR